MAKKRKTKEELEREAAARKARTKGSTPSSPQDNAKILNEKGVTHGLRDEPTLGSIADNAEARTAEIKNASKPKTQTEVGKRPGATTPRPLSSPDNPAFPEQSKKGGRPGATPKPSTKQERITPVSDETLNQQAAAERTRHASSVQASREADAKKKKLAADKKATEQREFDAKEAEARRLNQERLETHPAKPNDPNFVYNPDVNEPRQKRLTPKQQLEEGFATQADIDQQKLDKQNVQAQQRRVTRGITGENAAILNGRRNADIARSTPTIETRGPFGLRSVEVPPVDARPSAYDLNEVRSNQNPRGLHQSVGGNPTISPGDPVGGAPDASAAPAFANDMTPEQLIRQKALTDELIGYQDQLERAKVTAANADPDSPLAAKARATVAAAEQGIAKTQASLDNLDLEVRPPEKGLGGRTRDAAGRLIGNPADTAARVGDAAGRGAENAATAAKQTADDIVDAGERAIYDALKAANSRISPSEAIPEGGIADEAKKLAANLYSQYEAAVEKGGDLGKKAEGLAKEGYKKAVNAEQQIREAGARAAEKFRIQTENKATDVKEWGEQKAKAVAEAEAKVRTRIEAEAKEFVGSAKERYETTKAEVAKTAKAAKAELENVADTVKEEGKGFRERRKDRKAAKEALKADNPEINRHIQRGVKLGAGVELLDGIRAIARRSNEIGFDKALQETYTSLRGSVADTFERINFDIDNLTAEGNLERRDWRGVLKETGIVADEAAMSVLVEVATLFGARLPQGTIDFSKDLADLMGMPVDDLRFKQNTGFAYEQMVKPEGFSGFEGYTYDEGDRQPWELGGFANVEPEGAAAGLDVPPTTPGAEAPVAGIQAPVPETPGAAPMLGSDINAPMPIAEGLRGQDPFLEPTNREGAFNINNLGGASGTINAANAPNRNNGDFVYEGLADTFEDRVQESLRAGAYKSITPERRAQGQLDFANVQRGLAGIRSLSADRLGVPVKYLNAIRQGTLTPKQAWALENEQAVAGAGKGLTQFDIDEARQKQEMHDADLAGKVNKMLIEDANLLAGAVHKDPESREWRAYASDFITFANKMEGGSVAVFSDPNLREYAKGEFSLRKELEKEGILESIFPGGARRTAALMADPNVSVLSYIDGRQGTVLDWRDNNLLITVYDGAGNSSQTDIELDPETNFSALMHVAKHVNAYDKSVAQRKAEAKAAARAAK